MTYFVTYVVSTGEVVFKQPKNEGDDLDIIKAANLAIDSSYRVIEIPDTLIDDIYIVGDRLVIAKRTIEDTWNKKTITADGVDEAILTGLPNPCIVLIDAEPYVVDDTTLEVSTDTAGTVEVIINHPQFYYYTENIEAV